MHELELGVTWNGKQSRRDDRCHLVHEGVGRDYHRLGSQVRRLPRFLTCQVGDFFSSDALELKPNPRRSGCRGVVIVDVRGRDQAKTRCIVVVSEPFWCQSPSGISGLLRWHLRRNRSRGSIPLIIPTR
jgi:hypothetical protein